VLLYRISVRALVNDGVPEQSVIRYVKYTPSNYHHTNVFADFDRVAPHRSDALEIIIFVSAIWACSRRAFVVISRCGLCISCSNTGTLLHFK